jgi:hypothetical protein
MPNPSPAPLGNEAFFAWDNGSWAPENSLDLGVRIYGNAQETPGVREPGSLALVALTLLIVILLSTLVTPGAAHAARSAF